MALGLAVERQCGSVYVCSETTRSNAPQPDDSEKMWSLAVTDGSRAPLLITLVATCSMPRSACNARNARGGFDLSSHDRNLWPISESGQKAAELLLTRYGLEAALNNCGDEKSSARRARSRRRIRFRTAITSEIEARSLFPR